MKRMTWPFDDSISFKRALSRSSNSPRNLVPAINEPRSNACTRLSLSDSGTSPCAIRCASPSAIAVLPTPASPIKTGLFLVRRESTWMTRRISCSRPMTGSSLPSRARAVRSRVYFSSAWNLDSGVASVTRVEPRTWVRAWSNFSRALQRLTEAAEKAKIELSSRMETEVNLPFITADQNGPKHLEIKITRAKFEQLTADLTEKEIGPFNGGVKDGGVTPADLNEVILVGGATRMPAIQE